jgi:putative peptidoglycan lipid II flippase
MSLFKSGIIVAISTFISRVFGYVRDVLIASYLGTTDAMDVFAVAWRLPNFFRNLFAEGALSSAFVPILSSKMQSLGEQKAYNFASQVLTFLLLMLLLFVGACEIFMPYVMHIFAPGFLQEPEKFVLVVRASYITMPYLLLVSMCSIYSGLLNVKGHFMIGSLVPVILSISMIGALLCFNKFTDSHVISLAYGVLVAGFVQLIVLYCSARSVGARTHIVKPVISPDIKLLFRKMIPAIIGSSIVQLNLWVDTVIATTLDGAASKIYYAERLNQFPLAIIGTAIGTVLLPSLSKEVEKANFVYVNNLFERSVITSLVFSLAAASGLLSIGELMISVLFERGQFTYSDTIDVAFALRMLAIGLPAFILIKVLTPFYYSKLDTKTPLKISILCLIFNIGLSLSLIRFISYAGIPLATSICAWINFMLLQLFLLKDSNFKPNYPLLWNQIARICIAILIMLLSIKMLCSLLDGFINSSFKLDKLIAMLLIVTCSGVIYFAVVLYFNILDTKITQRFKLWK